MCARNFLSSLPGSDCSGFDRFDDSKQVKDIIFLACRGFDLGNYFDSSCMWRMKYHRIACLMQEGSVERREALLLNRFVVKSNVDKSIRRSTHCAEPNARMLVRRIKYFTCISRRTVETQPLSLKTVLVILTAIQDSPGAHVPGIEDALADEQHIRHPQGTTVEILFQNFINLHLKDTSTGTGNDMQQTLLTTSAPCYLCRKVGRDVTEHEMVQCTPCGSRFWTECEKKKCSDTRKVTRPLSGKSSPVGMSYMLQIVWH